MSDSGLGGLMFILVGWCMIGLIGGAIGSLKGRGFLGFGLGLLLGPLGWIIAAVVEKSPEMRAGEMAEQAELTALAQRRLVGPSAVPAGWHPDPWGEASLRWWDGTAWTGNVR